MSYSFQTHAAQNSGFTAQQATDEPDSEDPLVQQLKAQWKISNALRGGTDSFRKLGQLAVPQEELESDENHQRRINRAFLAPAMRETIAKLAAMPFAEAVRTTPPKSEIQSGFPGLHQLLNDVDGSGCDVTAFGFRLMHEALWHGMSIVLVDAEGVTGDTFLAAEKRVAEGKRRAIWKMIDPMSLIRLRFGRDAEGRNRIARIAYRTESTREKGDFATEKVETIYDFEPKKLRVWERVDDGSWDEKTEPDENGGRDYSRDAGWDRVPVDIYWPEGNADGLPPQLFKGMEEMSTQHFHRSAELGEILAHNMPMRVVVGEQSDGVDDVTIENPDLPPVSVQSVLRLKEGGSAFYLQSDASSVQVRIEEMREIERWIQMSGLDPMIQQADPRTATEVDAGERRNLSRMAAWVRCLERFIVALVDLSQTMVPNYTVPEELSFEVADGFEFPTDALERGKLLLETAIKMGFPLEAVVEQYVTLGILPPDFDVEAAMAMVEEPEEPAPEIIEPESEDEGDSAGVEAEAELVEV